MTAFFQVLKNIDFNNKSTINLILCGRSKKEKDEYFPDTFL